MFLYMYVLCVYVPSLYVSTVCIFDRAQTPQCVCPPCVYHVYVLSVCIHSTPEVYSEIALVWWDVKKIKLENESVIR